MKRRTTVTAVGSSRWTTVLGALLSMTVIGMGLKFGVAGVAGSLAIGLFALFVGAAAVASRRPVAASSSQTNGPGGSGPGGTPSRAAGPPAS